jgi:AraC family ethanolamine operon transcriptional activator
MENQFAEPVQAPVVSLKFSDFDEMAAAAVHAEDVEFVQLERGSLAGELVLVNLGPTVLQFSRHALGNLARATVRKDRAVVVVPLSTSVPHRWNGHTIQGREFVMYRPGTECQGCNPAGGTFIVVGVRPSDLARAMTALTGSDQPMPEANCTLFRPDADAMRALEAASVGALALARRNPHFLHNPSARRAIERSLLTALLHALASAAPGNQTSELTKLSHARIVAMAIDFLHAHPDEPIYIADLCVAAMVSERCLRGAFQEFYSMSPIRYLRLRRLNQVHRTLRDADPLRTTVTRAAMRYGFWELGRFAVDYKTLFGETPSDTLKRTAR